MKILKKYIPYSTYTRPMIKLSSIDGLVIHWIGVSQPSAMVISNFYMTRKR